MVRDLLRGLRARTRPAFLDQRTNIKNGKRMLRVDGNKALPVNDIERKRISNFMAEFAETHASPQFFKMIDMARRVAGTGSLGLERYVILVRGRGGPAGNFLLDLKYAAGSALAPYVNCRQPKWNTEAERIVSIQRRVQAISPAFLSPVTIDDRAFVLKELLPQQDRLSLNLWNGKLRRLEGVMQTMGAIVAWAHLRAGGREGSASADEWIDYGHRAASWRSDLLEYCQNYSQQVMLDWKHYAAAFQRAVNAKGGREF